MGRQPAKIQVNPGQLTEQDIDAWLITRPSGTRKDFFMAYNDSVFEVVLQRNLAAADMKVLFYMVAHMGYDNVCELSVSDIAEGLNLTRRVCTRAISRLLKIQVITGSRTHGRVTFYLISPYVFIKAKASEQKKIIAKWDALFEGVQPVLEVLDGRKSKTTTYETRSRRKSKSGNVTA